MLDLSLSLRSNILMNNQLSNKDEIWKILSNNGYESWPSFNNNIDKIRRIKEIDSHNRYILVVMQKYFRYKMRSSILDSYYESTVSSM